MSIQGNLYNSPYERHKIEAAFYRPDDDYIGYTEILSDFTDEDKTNKLFDYSANATVDRYIGIHYYSPDWKLNYHGKYDMWTEENKPKP